MSVKFRITGIANKEPKLGKRALFLFLLLLVLIFGGASLGWKFLANRLMTNFDGAIDRFHTQGRTIKCGNERAEGFPFRIGLFCDDVFYEDQRAGIRFEAGKLRTAAQIYKPGFFISELDGPALWGPEDLGQTRLNWDLSRTSVRMNLNGFKRISVNIKNLDIHPVNKEFSTTTLAKVDDLQLHLRPSNSDSSSRDLEVSLILDKLAFGKLGNNELPQIEIVSDFVIRDLYKVLKQGRDGGRWLRENGTNLEISNLELIVSPTAKLQMIGPAFVDTAGFITARLNFSIFGLSELAEKIVEMFPNLAGLAETIKGAAGIFSSSEKNGLRFQLDIRQGMVSLGFIPMGRIPSIYLDN